MLKYILLLMPITAIAENVPITGNVQSKCVINTDVAGVYGNPSADKLSTARADGGIQPVIRYDVSLANAYVAKITTPDSFSSSPSLTDSVAWTGSVAVKEVSDAAMSDYQTNRIEYQNTTEYDLHTAGTTWFEVSSTVEYGYGKSFPSGMYATVVTAECVAQ